MIPSGLTSSVINRASLGDGNDHPSRFLRARGALPTPKRWWRRSFAGCRSPLANRKNHSRTFAKGKGETMTKQETPQVIGVRHVGLGARDPAALAAFYRDVLGLQVVGGSTADTSAFGATAFLSSHPAEEAHDLALFANPVYRHTAFKVRSLADLRAIHQRIIDRGVPVKMALNHGVSLAFYFDDPEGHMVEVYWPTGVATRQPHGDPIDLSLSEEALRRDVAELAARAGAPPAASGAEPGRVVLTLPEE
jgi:catechol 2,3-dioxygenase-like lactoylglutathione lyase family enzyme